MSTGDRHSDYQALEDAWRSASDQRVSEALSHLEDLVDEAREVVLREAERRGVVPAFPVQSPTDHGSVLRAIANELFQLAIRHRYVTAILFSAGFVPFTMALPSLAPLGPWGVYILSNVLFHAMTVALCWPLTSYRIALGIALLASLSRGYVGLFMALSTRTMTAEDLEYYFTYIVGMYVAFAFVTWGLLCGVIFIRRRYWPVYEEGQCAKCGYDLRGLVEPRCPECGTPFDSPIPAPVDGQALTP